MEALGRLRQEALETLHHHFLVGNVSMPTLECRVELALAAQDTVELAHVVWDLPDVATWAASDARADTLERQPRRTCTRMSIRGVREVVLALDGGPRTWLIGRSRACDVVLAEADISRRHALVSVRGGQCSVRDLASTNGVHVNGRAVEVAVLEPGDLLDFGSQVQALVR